MIGELRGLIRLIRPHDCLSAGLATILGAALSGPVDAGRTLLAALIVFMLVASGTILNDVVDVDTDRINKQGRPLPGGAVRLPVARTMALLLGISAAVLSVTMGLWSAVVAGGAILLILLYDLQLKGSILIGNAVVSLLAALTVVYGAVVNGHAGGIVGPAVIVFTFMFTREILKTIQDHDADKLSGVRTVAVVLGRRRTYLLYSLMVIVFFAICLLHAGYTRSPGFLITITLGLVVPLLVGVILLGRRMTESNLKTTLFLTKWGFFIGLLALLLPRFGL